MQQNPSPTSATLKKPWPYTAKLTASPPVIATLPNPSPALAPPASSSANAPDPTRRKSCDVRARNTQSELFNIDDDRKGLPRKFEVELRGEEQRDDSGDEARVLDSDAEFKTMKELIDLEWERKKGAGRDLKEIAGTFC
ncbi:uncharacterized protein LOC110746892, partial [Prunus avium]|uniref:Uncharacterized protein LOC110746892 n=1 Tax=Prunus avium TaxID=42229 RepID=A0A6P5RLL7_PRUAV